jgi:hypothetical protein
MKKNVDRYASKSESKTTANAQHLKVSRQNFKWFQDFTFRIYGTGTGTRAPCLLFPHPLT